MPIMQQVKSDADFLKNLISSLKYCSITSDSVQLTGRALDEARQTAIIANTSELRKLELILESGIIPKKYHSIITNQDYLPSAEEQKKMSEPLPQAKYTFFATKKPRNIPEQKRSSFAITQDAAKPVMNFFIEHSAAKEYPAGGYAARLKKGYLKESDDKPKYAIKIYHQKMYSDNTLHELRVAMRAAYCHKQLGRESVCFRRNNKQYLVTEWLESVTLEDANQKQLQSISISRRIVMAISLLRQLSILHRQGLIHHNINPATVMVNFGKLEFIDLDSVTLKHEKPQFINETPMYTEKYLSSHQMRYDAIYNPENFYLQFNEQTDIYQTGLTLAHLFQEIYVPTETNNEVKVENSTEIFNCKSMALVRGSLYDKHSELQKLLKLMVFQETQFSLDADDCIRAFLRVLESYPDYKDFLKEDRFAELGKGLTKEDGEKAFKEIEIELLGYHQRTEAFKEIEIELLGYHQRTEAFTKLKIS